MAPHAPASSGFPGRIVRFIWNVELINYDRQIESNAKICISGQFTDFAYRISMRWWIFIIAGAAAMAIALVTVVFQAIKAAIANPVTSLRSE